MTFQVKGQFDSKTLFGRKEWQGSFNTFQGKQIREIAMKVRGC